MQRNPVRSVARTLATAVGDEEQVLQASRLLSSVAAIALVALGGVGITLHALLEWAPGGRAAGKHATQELITTIAQVDAGILVALAVDRVPAELPRLVVARLSAVAALGVFATAVSLVTALWALVDFDDRTPLPFLSFTDFLALFSVFSMSMGATAVAARLLAHGLDASPPPAGEIDERGDRP